MDLAVIGVDPGSKGAFCLFVPNTKYIEFRNTTDRAVDLFNWITVQDAQYNLAVCMIEEVGAIQGSAAKATFSFGANVERVNIIPEIAQISVDKVRPKEWQKFIGLVTPKNMTGPSNAKQRKTYIKKEVANIATRLYPKAELFGPKGGLLDGRSDSLMIAHYAARTLNY
jgi:hypothetical protein